MRWLYSAVMRLLQPMLRRKLLRRAQSEPLYGQWVEERLGIYSPQVVSGQVGGWIWVHAVSLGETRAAAPLIDALRAHFPGMRLLLTHGTATGRAQGQALLQAGDVQVWQPWDTPTAVHRFLTAFKPRMGVLLETEVWPNAVAGCQAAGVPLYLVNARMSDKSLRAALRLAWLSRPAYRGLTGVWAQSEDDAARLRCLGASVRGVMGNFKFDVVPDPTQCSLGQSWRIGLQRPVILFASSREGEEQMLLDLLGSVAWRDWAKTVHWLIVPRHPQRFDAVDQLFAQAGCDVTRRSEWTEAPVSSPIAADNGAVSVWLGNSLGEMALYYSLADVALLGGSFAPLGGQNLIEAAACGCPVLTGPHTFNFSEATQLAIQVGAARQCSGMEAALQQAQVWLQSPQALAEARVNAWDWVNAHRGAAQRTVQAIAHDLHNRRNRETNS